MATLSTTILLVRRKEQVCMISDGQITNSASNTVIKRGARKVGRYQFIQLFGVRKLSWIGHPKRAFCPFLEHVQLLIDIDLPKLGR